MQFVGLPLRHFPFDVVMLMSYAGSAVGGVMWGKYRAIQLISAPHTLHGVQIV